MLTTDFYDLLKRLIREPSVVGAEHPFFTVLRRELEERGARVSWYQGLLVAEGTHPESAWFSAHVDRHGLVCTGPGEFQYAAFVTGRRSDLLGNSVSERLISKVVDRYQSAPVYAYDPWSGAYLGCGEVSRAYVCERRKNLIFDIEGMDYLAPGTPVAFTDKLAMEEGRLSAQLDNVLTVAHLVHLFDHGFQGTLFFTAQEECGSSWRYLMEWFRRHRDQLENLVVVDTSPFLESTDAAMPDVVLRTRDANAAFNPVMTDRAESICNQHEVAYLFKDRYIDTLNQREMADGREPQSVGSTELGRLVVASEGAINGTTLQIPTTGYHTMEEAASVHANEAFARVLHSLAGV